MDFSDLYSSPISNDYSEASSAARFASVIPEGFKGSVLDYGCGTGRLHKWLHDNRKPTDYFGIDIRDSVIEQARYENPRVDFETAEEFWAVSKMWDHGRIWREYATFDLVVLIGKISYAFLEDIGECKRHYLELLRDLKEYVHSGGEIRLTLRRKGFESSADGKPMITFSREEALEWCGQIGEASIWEFGDREWVVAIR